MSKKKNIDKVIEKMEFGLSYSTSEIKTLCCVLNINSKSILKDLKKDDRVEKSRSNGVGQLWYSKIENENESIKKLSSSILKIILSENKKHISKWIDNEFEKKLNTAVEVYVEKEFKNEILPVLIDHIDKKVFGCMVTKGQVKEYVKEVLESMVKSLTQESEGI